MQKSRKKKSDDKKKKRKSIKHMHPNDFFAQFM